VPFVHHHAKMTLLRNDAALEMRRLVASQLTVPMIRKLRCRPDPSKPDLALMQSLYDAGFLRCPSSGMPVFNPSACAPGLLEAIWGAYCKIADSVNTKDATPTEALDGLKRLLDEHTGATE